ncbi:hypothetical protein C8Q77DRAFT_195505 [Trametes polyzona]|nr:hypothetical protein C8Q77DRAFT_195505 [Trametes polyzona]
MPICMVGCVDAFPPGNKSPFMGTAREVYTRLLWQRGQGYTLWEREPSHGEVHTGEVDYIFLGGFVRTFNATLPEDHLSQQHFGVPADYEPPTYPEGLVHRRPHALAPGPLCSNSVSVTQ